MPDRPRRGQPADRPDGRRTHRAASGRRRVLLLGQGGVRLLCRLCRSLPDHPLYLRRHGDLSGPVRLLPNLSDSRESGSRHCDGDRDGLGAAASSICSGSVRSVMPRSCWQSCCSGPSWAWSEPEFRHLHHWHLPAGPAPVGAGTARRLGCRAGGSDLEFLRMGESERGRGRDQGRAAQLRAGRAIVLPWWSSATCFR